MEFDKSEFFQVFYEEASEHLEMIESLLVALDVQSPDEEALNAIFRAVHSVKGGAGTFGFDKLTKVTHVFETILDQVRKGILNPSSEMIDLFLETRDHLSAILLSYKDGSAVDERTSTRITKALQKITSDAEKAPKKKTHTKAKVKKPAKSKKSKEEEDDLGFGFFGDLPSPEGLEKNKKAEAITTEAKITGSTVSKAPTETTSLRIGVEKVDQLFNQVGEIVITQAMLSQTASRLDPAIFEQLENGLAQLERNTRDLQESVMAIRMVPIKNVFSRYPRLVRDMKKDYNKEIHLVMIGEETEIDKGFIEKLSDPLTHLLRNSFDHGIESPEARKAAGKNPEGTITLAASHQGGNVVIEVRDDGAGLDRDRILEKAKEKGIACPEGMSDSEVWNLIFAPGFSTAITVSDISGRGVGMDVVKQNVQAMGGIIEIESCLGQGSHFIIRLPLTLAIIEGMVIQVGKEVYILPITSIVESLRPKNGETKTIMGKGEVVNLRGEYIPIIRLYELFNTPTEVKDPEHGVLVVIESDGGRSAVLVDELVGQQQVVIKSMEKNFKKIHGIAGATILGDGYVAFILDVRTLRAFSKKEESALVSSA